MNEQAATLTARQLCRELGISEAQYFRTKWRFSDLIQQPAVTKRVRYNRALVEQFKANQFSHARSFGRRGAA